MQVFLPCELKNWLTTEKPSEGDILFIAAVSLFAGMTGVKTFQEWDSHDIKALLWDSNEIMAYTDTIRLKDQGVLEVIQGLQGLESFRLHPNLKVNGTKLLSRKSSIAVDLKETKSIYLLGYLLGRLAHIRTNIIEDIVVNRYPTAAFMIKEKNPYYERKYGTGIRKEYRISEEKLAKDEEKRKASTMVNVIPLIYMKSLTTNNLYV